MSHARIIVSLLLACCIGLALTPAARAENTEELPYAKVNTDTIRINEILEDSKTICWKAMGADDFKATIDRETYNRDYNVRDKFILVVMCQAYREGARDGIRVHQELLRRGISRS